MKNYYLPLVEVDIAGAVSMYALTLAAQGQSALLDWNNNFAEDRNKCVLIAVIFPKSFVRNDLKAWYTWRSGTYAR